MSPFLSQDGKTFKGRVHDRAGRRFIRSLGTRQAKEAELIEAFCAACRTRRDWRTLDAIIGGRLSASAAYYLSLEGRLPGALDDLDAQAEEDAEPDASLLVGEWARVARSLKYVSQVRQMIPEGTRFAVSRFTRGAISAHLASLGCAEPTRNRHRVALSQFARWLVEREYLAANPVRDVRGFRERDPRMIHYTREETRAVSDRLPLPFNVAAAFMWGAALELGAVLALRARDVDLQTRDVSAKGSKTRWRTRTVRVTEDAAWALIRPYARLCMPDALLFRELRERAFRAAHTAACQAAGVPVSRLHDWRHTYAVQALRDGMAPQTVKRQLGHSPHSTMLERVYGAWIPRSDADYVATNLATSATLKVAAQGAK
jgi:integrase